MIHGKPDSDVVSQFFSSYYRIILWFRYAIAILTSVGLLLSLAAFSYVIIASHKSDYGILGGFYLILSAISLIMWILLVLPSWFIIKHLHNDMRRAIRFAMIYDILLILFVMLLIAYQSLGSGISTICLLEFALLIPFLLELVIVMKLMHKITLLYSH